jgi:hypothetical protein
VVLLTSEEGNTFSVAVRAQAVGVKASLTSTDKVERERMYEPPVLTVLGSVAELTECGGCHTSVTGGDCGCGGWFGWWH